MARIISSFGVASITVKFMGPTNYKPSRYKATSQAGSLTFSADYALNPTQNAEKVAMALAEKLDWNGDYILGYLPESEKSYWVYVQYMRKADE